MRDSRLAVSQTDRGNNTVNAALQIDSTRINHLGWLESEAIHILREVAAECSNPALLFSGGKDSIVMLRLAEKAFRPRRHPSLPAPGTQQGQNTPLDLTPHLRP